MHCGDDGVTQFDVIYAELNMATEDDVSTVSDYTTDVVEGANLSERFRVLPGGKGKASFSVTPVLVDFSRLLQQQQLNRSGTQSSTSIISGVC